MLNYLQLILINLFIAFLILYISAISIKDSFKLPVFLKPLLQQVNQQQEQKSLAKEIMERQKMLFEYRQRQFRETMRTQKQKTSDTMRVLKERLQNARHK